MNDARTRDIACVYAAGFLQGCAFVLIPALATVLTARPFVFGAQSYAMLYLPQSGGAIAGAVAAGWLQRQVGVGWLLRLGLAANFLAMALLVVAAHTAGRVAYGLLLGETMLLGIGFGWTLAALNHYGALFFSGSSAVAITLLNALIGAATACSPLLLGVFRECGSWALWPLVLAAGFAVTAIPRLPEDRADRQGAFWPAGLLPFALVALIYAICEGSLGSWANFFVSADRHLGEHAGTLALSSFWASMTLVRVLLAPVPERWISRRSLLMISALGIGAIFALLPWLGGATALIMAFALAGAVCSIYFPFVMALTLARFVQQQTQVAGLLVAALMVGESLGSYGLGLLQSTMSLSHIYLWSSLWGFLLLAGAMRIHRSDVASTD